MHVSFAKCRVKYVSKLYALFFVTLSLMDEFRESENIVVLFVFAFKEMVGDFLVSKKQVICNDECTFTLVYAITMYKSIEL